MGRKRTLRVGRRSLNPDTAERFASSRSSHSRRTASGRPSPPPRGDRWSAQRNIADLAPERLHSASGRERLFGRSLRKRQPRGARHTETDPKGWRPSCCGKSGLRGLCRWAVLLTQCVPLSGRSKSASSPRPARGSSGRSGCGCPWLGPWSSSRCRLFVELFAVLRHDVEAHRRDQRRRGSKRRVVLRVVPDEGDPCNGCLRSQHAVSLD